MQHIHILGIGGTFMAGVAVIAKTLGYRVTGSDQQIYPPMSTLLQEQGIIWFEGYDPSHLSPRPDCVIVGNAMKRGNPCVEALLNLGLNYTSGPQWLAENVLNKRHVLAVAGTHGKTTTSSLLTWILEQAGLNPSYLIGGIPNNFPASARVTDSPFFVIEADEYDSAFFDKRSKFVHYRPRTLILNNLEFDHADIFPDLSAIQTQFHHLVRTVPSEGKIICHGKDKNLSDVLERGCWTPVEYFSFEQGGWQVESLEKDGSVFRVLEQGQEVGIVRWSMLGKHNMLNALAALAAAKQAGVAPSEAVKALNNFSGVKRRLEIKLQKNNITVYDDFAHHPTAIATTLEGLRHRVGKQRIFAIVELASNTMRMGVHRETLPSAFNDADVVWFARPKPQDWGISDVAHQLKMPTQVFDDVTQIADALAKELKPGDHVVVMSNSGFGGIQEKIALALKTI